MSVLVLFELNAKPENVIDLTNWLRDGLHHTRGFDGCNGISIHRDQENPNNMVFVEDWDSREQYDKYLAWRAERGDVETLTGWMIGEPSIRSFDNVGV